MQRPFLEVVQAGMHACMHAAPVHATAGLRGMPLGTSPARRRLQDAELRHLHAQALA
jgi:hypothetical protein